MNARRPRADPRSPIALAACLLAALCTAACPDEARGADALGASRLFFAASERQRGGGGEIDGKTGSPGATADDAGKNGAAGEGAPTSSPASESARSAAPSERGPIARRLRFQALLGSGESAQVMLDGRLCRAGTRADDGLRAGDAPRPLRCAAMPPGVRALQLLAEPPQLLVTTLDGRRHRLTVGGSVTLSRATPR